MKTTQLFWSIIFLLIFQKSFSQGTNNALNFDGINDYVTIDPIANSLTGQNSFTVEFWMKSTAIPGGNGGACLFAINDPGNIQNGLLLMVRDGGELGVSDLANWMGFTGTTVINDGECHHIAYVKTGGTAVTYVDGLLQATAVPITSTHVIAPTDRVSLAQEWDPVDGGLLASNFYNGNIDDLRIWSTGRTAAEIADNMHTNFTGIEPNLIALYDFDQGTIAAGDNTSEGALENLTAAGPALNGNFQGLTLTGESSNFLLQECACQAPFDSGFTTITENITTNTFWTNKIFIPDNTIIQVSSDAVLDISNVDVVFGQCAGIDFIGNASLRANNAVFRPCSLGDTWRGLRFDQESEMPHQINESTFKNAEIALNFERSAHGVVNGNTLINCNEGIYLRNSTFNRPVSILANNFLTNNDFPDYTNCYNYTDPNDIIYIHANAQANANQAQKPILISQNSMVLASQNNTESVTGIDLLTTTSTISENKITNMTYGIIIQNPYAQTNIESNEIEFNSIHESILSNSQQISVFNANGPKVNIGNNELINNHLKLGETRGAIFLQRAMNVHVDHNSIEGFDNGIVANFSPNAHISENVLTSIKNIGIHFQEGSVAGMNFITCNDVTMVMGQGVGIRTEGTSSNTQISSNCVKDATEGIRTEGNGTIPVIRNNYIYNYSIGINNIGQNGNVGTAGNPGLNTLWSNNNGAMDVASSGGGTLNIADNFGMFNITFATVTITSANPFHSTASCGHQIFNMPSQGNLNVNYTCDNKFKSSAPMKSIGNYTVLPTLEEARNYFENTRNKTVALYSIASHVDCEKDYLESLMSSCDVALSEEIKIRYTFYKTKGDTEKAFVELNNLNNPSDFRFKSTETANLKIMSGMTLSSEELEDLKSIANDATVDGLSNLAVTLTKTTTNRGSYRFTNPTFESFDLNSMKSDYLEENMAKITAFPNPANDVITFQILNDQNLTNQNLVVYNIHGEIMKQQQLDFAAGQVQFDISELALGAYFVVLNSDEGVIARSKFIKN